MTIRSRATTAAVMLPVAAFTLARSGHAHDTRASRSTGGEYRIAAVGTATHEGISVAGETLSAWALGSGIKIYAGQRLAPSYRTGVELALTLVSPVSELALEQQTLEGIAIFSGAALWMNYVGDGIFTWRLGLGPAMAHVFESSGTLDERTAFGIRGLAGVGWECTPHESLSFDIGVAGTLSQLFTGSDQRHAIEQLRDMGLLLTVGFRYGSAPETRTNKTSAASRSDTAHVAQPH